MKTVIRLAHYPAHERTLSLCIDAVAADYREFDYVPAYLCKPVVRGLARTDIRALVTLIENIHLGSSMLDEDTCIRIARADPYAAAWYLPSNRLDVAVANAIIDTAPDAAAILPDELLAELD